MYRHGKLTKIGSWISGLAGHPITFCSIGILTTLWFIIWIFKKFDNAWLAGFSVFTTILTFLLAFIIQHTQDRETAVIEIKLNELIRISKGAHNALLDLEKLPEQDIDLIRSGYAEIAARAREELRKGKTDLATGVVEVRSLSYLVNPETVLQDRKRLAALQRLKLIDTPPEEYFDTLTRLAQLTLGAPVALLSILDQNRQFFKSAVGLPPEQAGMRETPLSHSLCKYTVASGKPFIVNDAKQNPLVSKNGAVRDLNVQAYCGIPLITADQQAVGSFCVVDTQPRVWQDRDLAIMKELAALAMARIVQRV